jgi:hypothetical protein
VVQEGMRLRSLTKPRQANTAVPLLLPPPSNRDKSLDGMSATDAKKSTETNSQTTSDNKIAALHAYRRSRGLCQYCVEKYSRGHKCAAHVQLHAVQELWDLLQGEPDLNEVDDHSDTEIQLNVLLYKEALSSGGNSKSFKFLGSIQGCEVMVLVDSGSSHSFVNMKLLPCLQGASDLHSLVMVSSQWEYSPVYQSV